MNPYLTTFPIPSLVFSQNSKQTDQHHSQTDYSGCRTNFITWLDDSRLIEFRWNDWSRSTKFILNEYPMVRDELSIHTRDILAGISNVAPISFFSDRWADPKPNDILENSTIDQSRQPITRLTQRPIRLHSVTPTFEACCKREIRPCDSITAMILLLQHLFHYIPLPLYW